MRVCADAHSRSFWDLYSYIVLDGSWEHILVTITSNK